MDCIMGAETRRRAVAELPAQDGVDRHAPGLAQDVEAGELERGQDLGPVVVERRRGIGDAEAHLLDAGGVVAR